MSVRETNVQVEFDPNSLDLSDLNVTEVEEINNGRATPASEPRGPSPSPSPFQSFVQKAKAATKKVSKVFKRPSSPALSVEEVQETPLYKLVTLYLAYPTAQSLQKIKQEVKELGYEDPTVQTLRIYAEHLYEDALYTREGKAEGTLVNALGGSRLSYGGRRTTRKRKTRSQKRKLSKRK
jgi:hypothetical protein